MLDDHPYIFVLIVRFCVPAMIHNGREASVEADVVFVVEATALSGAYMPELVDNYIKPTLEYVPGLVAHPGVEV